jgi:excisionase family DNA binding protein
MTENRPVVPPVEVYLTVKEVADRLQISRWKVYDLIRSRELASFLVGRSRRVPLLGIARDALMAHSAMQVIGGPHPTWARHELVFTTRTGQPMEPRNLARSFHRIARSAGLRPIRLHGLRHTAATLLKTLDVPARDAMGILGHSRVAVTLEVYNDADDPSRKEAIDRISRLLGGGNA